MNGSAYSQRQERPALRRMADLARLAGVSKTTVSRALADSPLVKQQTKERIRALARAHGYVVNEQARNFRLGRTNTIAVALPLDPASGQLISDPFFSQLIAEIADALNARGFDLLLSRVDVTDPRWPQLLSDASRIDGAIVIGQWREHARLNLLAAEEALPFVVWGARLEDQHYITVGCDNPAGAQAGVGHLLEHGYRQIAFLGDRGLPEVAQRYTGYCRAFEAVGLTPPAALAIDAHSVRSDAHAAVTKLLASGAQPDAIFATSDVLAMAATAALGEHGIDVPETVAVMGFDDITLAEWCNPPLTTLRQHIPDGAGLLVDRLIAQLDGRPVASRLLTPELVIRGSCGCAPQQKAPATSAATSTGTR